MIAPKHLIISRTDSIGDVLLTMPMVTVLARKFPATRITFLGSAYTRDLIMMHPAIHQFADWGEIASLPPNEQVAALQSFGADAILHVFPRRQIAFLAKAAGIRIRIGASGRLYHFVTCNRVVLLSRKKSDTHEAIHNLALLRPLGIKGRILPEDIASLYGLKFPREVPPSAQWFLDPGKTNVILHPGSRGSGREWGLDNFARLIQSLPPSLYNIILTGNEGEGKNFRPKLVLPFAHVRDSSGSLSLSGLTGLIAQAQVMVAASTGPIHIAAAAGIHAIGLFAPIRPIHPARWRPLGKNVSVLVNGKSDCNKCKNDTSCICMQQISPESVAAIIQSTNYNP